MQAEPPKAEPPKRKRRWFQYSVRTLMIVVTLLAVGSGYVGWQAKIVRERDALSEKRDGVFMVIAVDDTEVPLVRRMLGDHQYMAVLFDDAPPEAILRRYRAAFPEAEVRTDGRIVWESFKKRSRDLWQK
jgi:hypothetical protein